MPAAERPPVLVWRRGEALLAAEVETVVEVAEVTAQGAARSRAGMVPLLFLPGLPHDPAGRAIVVRAAAGLVGLPADGVEGIRAVADDRVAAPPRWLADLAPDHVRALILLDDDRLAALLDVECLRTT